MIKEWLKETYSTHNYGYLESVDIRSRITCNDGFSMSVQASEFHYCVPRKNLPNGDYEAVEIGFPSEDEELIAEYAEDSSNLTETVYGWVPVEIVDKVIEKHCGMKAEEKICE